jgi:hypothetical protein
MSRRLKQIQLRANLESGLYLLLSCFLFLVSCLLRVELQWWCHLQAVELHKLYLYLVGNLKAYSSSVYLVALWLPSTGFSQSHRWDPMGSEILCSWFLLGLLLQRQIPRRSQLIKSFSILYLILFQLPLMSVLHLVVVLVIG